MHIIAPQQFKTIPWKNGKGVTTELAISPHASLDDFSWRLSIATVAEDGPFSDFSGLQRNLVLIEGAGIILSHDGNTENRLENVLDFATFDGGSQTTGTLLDGPIKDFNIMHDPSVYQAQINTFNRLSRVELDTFDLAFAYPLQQPIQFNLIPHNGAPDSVQISTAHLLCLDASDSQISAIEGENFILIRLRRTTK